MRSAKLYQYRLPMDSGVILRDRRLTVREGWIVELRQGKRWGRGEIAPLPQFSEETAAQAGSELQRLLELWVAGNAIDLNSALPSVAFGLSMAQLELAGGLPRAANHESAPLCIGAPEDFVIKLNQMAGNKIAKIKIGIYQPLADGMAVNRLFDAFPELALRLDANRAWSPVQASQFANSVQPQHRAKIVFLEEPCKKPQDSLVFAQETGIAIAWDETVREPGFAVTATQGVAAIIIKPTLTGSLARCIELIEQAHDQGLVAVISSSIESSFGLNQLARIARWLTPDVIPGLDTIDMFQQQLETPWPTSSLPVIPLSDLTLVRTI